MLKRSRETAEYYMAELSTYVLATNDDVNYVLRAKQASACSDVACSQLSYLHAYQIELALSSYETGSGVPRHYDVLESDQALLSLEQFR